MVNEDDISSLVYYLATTAMTEKEYMMTNFEILNENFKWKNWKKNGKVFKSLLGYCLPRKSLDISLLHYILEHQKKPDLPGLVSDDCMVISPTAVWSANPTSGR